MSAPVVIVGSGLAGYMLAKEYRKLNKEAALRIITGSDGTFYSKPQLSTALTQKKSLEALALSSAESMQQQLNACIDTHTWVETIDTKQRQLVIKRSNGERETINYDRLILAVGANTVKPPLKGDAVSELCSVNHLEDYERFQRWLPGKKRIGILGAGLVGCEFTNDLINNGYEVHVAAPETHPLARFIPEPVGAILKKQLQQKGVVWHLERLALSVNHVASGYQIKMLDGSELIVDGVFSAIGLRPNCDLAMGSDIKTQQGICVNRYLQTSAPGVYALGDCAEVADHIKMYVAPLLQCARALAKILAGGDEPVHYPSMPIVVKTPACPIVVSTPPEQVQGTWQYEGEGNNLKALYFDQEQTLRGFALVGECVRERLNLAKQLPLNVFS